ncbi:c-type cytochrome [Phenylobacterium sp. LjRoot219]|uniref:c-type cytochrome n=1 Tax=Phenylobacterium sp. LjRoot219 TaxID=3342283 RepID=UPI003ECE1C1D
MRNLAVILVLAVAATACASAGEGPAATDRGERFARRACAGCHAIGPTGASPYDPAPPFRTLAARLPGPALQARLSAIALRGHGQMPPIYMTPDEIDAVAAYVRAVAAPGPGLERPAINRRPTNARAALAIFPRGSISGA